jgi:hypothetical protein
VYRLGPRQWNSLACFRETKIDAMAYSPISYLYYCASASYS